MEQPPTPPSPKIPSPPPQPSSSDPTPQTDTPQPISSKEYTITEILSRGWKLFNENFKLLATLVLVICLPFNIISFMITGQNSLESEFNVEEFFTENEITAETSFEEFFAIMDSYDPPRSQQALGLIKGLLSILVTMAIAFAIKTRLDGKTIEWKTALKKSLSRLLPAIGTSVLETIFLIGLFLLLIIPGIIYAFYWMFAIYAVILKDQAGKDALNYSKSIVKGRWWKILWYCLVIGLCALVAFAGVGLVYGLIAGIPYTGILFDTVIDLVVVFFMVVSTVFFLNFDASRKTEASPAIPNS